jgi:D-alanyl-D-alanine dipeptidase
MTEARKRKVGYRSYPLSLGPRNAEALVDIAEYGIAGQSYYSRPNAAIAAPIAGAAPRIMVRQSIAEKLAAINYELQDSDAVSELLGGAVELYVEEGVRPPALQKHLYETVFPQIIKEQNPSWTTAQILARRDELIADPDATATPSPHATGAAVDITLRYTNPSMDFAQVAKVEFGRKKMDMGDSTNPDYFEHKPRLTKVDQIARDNRRIFYWVMRGALLDDDSSLEVNPTEFWHWSYGDQMWAALRQAPTAFFGA